jgi:uncharacterized zinc-type alcohol dehydrogenase-like protein
MTPAKGYAAQDKHKDLAPWNFERREPGPHDVRIEIRFCGVCHSDLHQIRDEWGGSIYPMVPGHEIVGKVTAVGTHAKKHRMGDLVAVGCQVDSCRVCDNCRQGLEQYCINGASPTYNGYEQDKKTPTYGGYSDTVVVHEDFVLKISEKLDLAATAPLLCAGITTWSPLRYWRAGKGTKVAIVGLGGLGHMGVKFAASLGAEVTVLSTSPKKEKDAKKLGAHSFALTNDPARLKPLRGYFDLIVDCVSADHDLDLYLRLLKTNGTHVCVGLPSKPASLNIFSIIGRKNLAGSINGGIPETQEMLDYCALHNIVSDIELIDIKYIRQAYDRMLKGDVQYRFVIDMATL